MYLIQYRHRDGGSWYNWTESAYPLSWQEERLVDLKKTMDSCGADWWFAAEWRLEKI